MQKLLAVFFWLPGPVHHGGEHEDNGDDEAVYVVPAGVPAEGGEGCGLQAAHKSQ